MPISVYAIDALSTQQIATWNQLLLSSPLKSAFLSHAFCEAVNAVRGGVFVLHSIEEDGAEGFLPFQMRRGRSLLGHAEKVGAGMSDFFGAVGTFRMTHHPKGLLQAAGLSALRLDHVVPALCPFSFEDMEIRRGARLRTENFTQFRDGLLTTNKNFVKSVLYYERRLAKEHGAIEFSWKTTEPGSFRPADRDKTKPICANLRSGWLGGGLEARTSATSVCLTAGPRMRGLAVDPACGWKVDCISIESSLRKYLA